VAAGPLAFGPAAARVVELCRRGEDSSPYVARAQQLLRVMERELRTRDWLAVSSPTLADIANYSYVVSAPEGRVPLDDYPAVRAWLARVEALPGFVPMPESRVGLRA
ncbi:MAG TPA: glutathione binding-like protein, partial [Ramlibacter sp.]